MDDPAMAVTSFENLFPLFLDLCTWTLISTSFIQHAPTFIHTG